MQIVYISNRPEVLLETLKHVELFMPFIGRAIACVPDNQQASFSAGKANDRSALPITVIPESAILTTQELNNIQRLDHQRRNYLLRTRLFSHPEIDDCCILSDDDARPLKVLAINRFVENDRYRNYFFYHLSQWDNNQTEFDVGQISTHAVLNYCGLPQRSYASHMPQVIDRELFLEAAQFFKEYAQSHPLCEWSSYFNYAIDKYPDRFHVPEVFATLCWPEHPLSWKMQVQPNEFLFENYTPDCYQHDQVFADVSPQIKDIQKADIERNSLNKIIRWQQYSIACRYPEQGKSSIKYIHPRTWVNKLFRHLS